MVSELCRAYEDVLWMLEDGIRKTPDERWRSGVDEYLVPARIAYHIVKSLEFLTNELPGVEFLRTRRFKLDWLGAVDAMPDRAALLLDLDWVRERIMTWLPKADIETPESAQRVQKALYYLRHSQHHVGEYGIIARLAGFSEPQWR